MLALASGKSVMVPPGGRCGRDFMRRLATSTWLASISLAWPSSPTRSFASDIVWEVQSPFRFFKKTSAFTLHEKAFEAVRGKAESPLPGNIVWRTERRLNDPDCADKSSPARCHATARKGFERSRLGWAAQTLDSVCYERNSRPFRYPTSLRPPVFLGHREGRLHPARRPHGRRDAVGRAPRRGRRPAIAPSPGRRAPAPARARASSSPARRPS